MTTITRERLPDYPQELPDVPRKLKKRAARALKIQRLLYACIPAIICRDPRLHDLTPLEVAVAGTLLSLARHANAINNYGKAFKFGGNIIDQEAANHNTWRKAWKKVKRARKRGEQLPAPQRYHAYGANGTYKPVKIKQAMVNAGTLGFQHAMKKLRRQPLPDEVVFSVTRSALVRHVGLSKCADNLKAVDAALTTLSDVIRTGTRMRLPMIKLDRSPTMLTITVYGSWANQQYYRVPLPLPTKSPLATQLLLWTCSVGGVKDESVTKRSSNYKKFSQMFGHSITWRANEAVNRALYFLNDNYFPRLDKKALRPFGIKPPDAIEIVEDDGRIKLVGLTMGTYRYDQAMQRGHRNREELRWNDD